MVSNLVKLFWKVIEEFTPDQADLRLSEETSRTGGKGLLIRPDGKPRLHLGGPFRAIEYSCGRTPPTDGQAGSGWRTMGVMQLGYTGSLNLLYRYITQGRADGDKPVTTPQRLARLLLTRPENLRDKDTALLRELTRACPELSELARFTGEFAQLLTPAGGNDAKLAAWITTVRAADLPHLHSFANGLELDRAAVGAGLTLPHHNGRTEGVNTRTKRIMRQMHGLAGFPLLLHRILLQ